MVLLAQHTAIVQTMQVKIYVVALKNQIKGKANEDTLAEQLE